MTFDQKIAAQAGLVRYHTFTSSDTSGSFGDDICYFINGGQTNPVSAVLDSSDLASGHNSLKFTIPSQSSAGASGQWTMRFASDNSVTYGAGQTFWVQWMQKFDKFLFQHTFSGGGGWKQAIIGTADGAGCSSSSTGTCASSCSDLEVVMQNTFQRGFPQIYNSCGTFTPLELGPIYGSDFDRQPHQGTLPPAASYCFTGSESACETYAEGLASPTDQWTQWGTFTISITLGTVSGGFFQNSVVKAWVSWGGAGARQLFDYTTNLVSSGSQKYGRVWLLPYHSGKDATEVHTETYTKYANVIIATQPIPLTTDETSSTLYTVAAPLSVGSFAQLTTTGASGIFTPSAGGSILEYTDRCHWNPLDRTILVQGGSHQNSVVSCAETKLVKYTESTNAWTTVTNACTSGFDTSFTGGIGHSYQHDTLDPDSGDIYHRNYGAGNWSRFIYASQTWAGRTAIPSGAFQVAGATAYFPERNSIIFLDGDWGVWEFSIAGNSWTQLAATKGGGFSPQITPTGSYHVICVYCSHGPYVVLGGGSDNTGLYRLNSSGTFTTAANAPSGVDLATPQNGSGSVVTTHPSTGDLILWNKNGTGYTYDPVANTWSATGWDLPFAPTPAGNVSNVVATPIADYGVVFFGVDLNSSTQIWLLKTSTVSSVSTPDTLQWTAYSV